MYPFNTSHHIKEVKLHICAENLEIKTCDTTWVADSSFHSLNNRPIYRFVILWSTFQSCSHTQAFSTCGHSLWNVFGLWKNQLGTDVKLPDASSGLSKKLWEPWQFFPSSSPVFVIDPSRFFYYFITASKLHNHICVGRSREIVSSHIYPIESITMSLVHFQVKFSEATNHLWFFPGPWRLSFKNTQAAANVLARIPAE